MKIIISEIAKRIAARKGNTFRLFQDQVAKDNEKLFETNTLAADDPFIINSYNFYSAQNPNANKAATAGVAGAATAGAIATTKGSGLLGSTIKGLEGMVNSATAIGEYLPDTLYSISDALNLIMSEDRKSLLNPFKIGLNLINVGAKEITLYLKQQSDLQSEINTKTSLTGKLSKNFREEITKASVSATLLGYNFKEVAEAASKILVDAGRFKLVSSETLDSVALTSRIFYDSLEEGASAVEQFQKVSRGASDAMNAVEKVGKSSLRIGLNAKETTKKLTENISSLNSFGFKNGIEGLTKMVQKAQSLRMDMTSIYNLADKVMNPEDALSLAANLQVIGGALGDFNDPIKLMYMSTNNVQGLQDALVGSLDALVDFSQESKTFEITGANLRRVRAMADALNMDYKDLANTAIQSAQRVSAANDLMSTGIKMDDDEKEFLTNLSQMKGGKMVIEIPESLRKSLQMTSDETSIALEGLTEKQIAVLREQEDAFKDPKMEDLAKQQVSLQDNMVRNLTFLAATARVTAGQAGEKVARHFRYDPMKIQDEMFKMSKDVSGTIKKGINDAADWSMKTGDKVGEWLNNVKLPSFKEVTDGAEDLLKKAKEKISGIDIPGIETKFDEIYKGIKEKAQEKGVTSDNIKEHLKTLIDTTREKLNVDKNSAAGQQLEDAFKTLSTGIQEKLKGVTEANNQKISAVSKDMYGNQDLTKQQQTAEPDFANNISGLSEAINNAKVQINTQSLNLETGAKTMGDVLTTVNSTLPDILKRYESIVSRYEAIDTAPKKIDLNITSDAVFDTLRKELLKDNSFISELKKSIIDVKSYV